MQLSWVQAGASKQHCFILSLLPAALSGTSLYPVIGMSVQHLLLMNL